METDIVPRSATDVAFLQRRYAIPRFYELCGGKTGDAEHLKRGGFANMAETGLIIAYGINSLATSLAQSTSSPQNSV